LNRCSADHASGKAGIFEQGGVFGGLGGGGFILNRSRSIESFELRGSCQAEFEDWSSTYLFDGLINVSHAGKLDYELVGRRAGCQEASYLRLDQWL
jgi:hypothetical protein